MRVPRITGFPSNFWIEFNTTRKFGVHLLTSPWNECGCTVPSLSHSVNRGPGLYRELDILFPSPAPRRFVDLLGIHGISISNVHNVSHQPLGEHCP